MCKLPPILNFNTKYFLISGLQTTLHPRCGGLTAVEMGGGVGGENMCEDLRSGSGNIGMCIPSARSSVTFLTSVLKILSALG